MERMIHTIYCSLQMAWGWAGTIHLKDILTLGIAITALTVTLWDRKPKFTVKARKGNWCTLNKTQSGSEFIFRGIVELYNASSRANAITGYEFWGQREENGTWEAMESEYFQESINDEVYRRSNITPFTVGPYSGAEIEVMALAKKPQPYEMNIRIEIEDLFGHKYRVQVKAVS